MKRPPHSTAVREMPPEERPRERLDRLGPEALRDAELIAVLFRTGTRDQGAIALAESLLRHFNGLRGVARAYHSLAQIYHLQEEWDQALEFYEKDLALSRRAGDLRAMANAYRWLSSTCLRKGEQARAFELDKKLLAVSERLGDFETMAHTLTLLGLAYEQKGDERQAIACYERGLAIAEELGRWVLAVRYRQLLSEQHRKAGRIEDARLHSAHAMVILAREGSQAQISAYRHLVELCGSEDAAETYLKVVVDTNPDPETPLSV